MNYVKLAHIAKAKAGLSDEEYRNLLQGACMVRSSVDIKSAWQWNKIRVAFYALGVKLPYDAGRKVTSSPVQKKCFALWCRLAEQGKVQDKNYKAMDMYRRKMFGNVDIMHKSQWLHFVEILKKWVERD